MKFLGPEMTPTPTPPSDFFQKTSTFENQDVPYHHHYNLYFDLSIISIIIIRVDPLQDFDWTRLQSGKLWSGIVGQDSILPLPFPLPYDLTRSGLKGTNSWQV